MIQMPIYEQVSKVLEDAKIAMSPAEAHGMISGFICAGAEMNGRSWLDLILRSYEPDQKNLTAVRDLLLKIYEVSSIKLPDIQLDFNLLLPNDDIDLIRRAEALSHWSQGFIIALELAGVDLEHKISYETLEAIHHVLEISQLDYESIEVREEDELAYIEVMEYVRVTIMMIYTEMASHYSKNGSASKYLH